MRDRYGPWPPSRPIARELGTIHFFTGRPCRRGHLALRITNSGNCLVCKREAERETSLERLRRVAATETPEQRREKERRYREAHRHERNAKKRETREYERFMQAMIGGEA